MRSDTPARRAPDPWVLYALSLAPFLVLAVRQWDFLPRIVDGDFAQYILHAKALVEGRPYIATGYIYTPYTSLVSPPAQPPGLPLTLVPLIAIFGIKLAVLKIVVVAAAAAFALIAGVYFGRRTSPWLGAGIILLEGIALMSEHATIAVIADLPFCAVCWWLISTADRDGPWTRKRAAAVAILGIVAVSYRVAGAALGPAAVLYGLMRPRGQRAIALVPAGVWLAGALVALVIMPDAVPFLGQIFREPEIYVARTIEFVKHSRGAVLVAMLYPFPWNRANDAFHLVMIVPLLIGLWRLLVDWRGTFVWCFTIGYVVTLVVAPVHEPRYLWPLYPVLHFAMLSGGLLILEKLLGTRRRASTPAMALDAPTAMRASPRPAVAAGPAPRLVFGLALVLGLLSTVILFRERPPRSLLGDPDARDLFAWLRAQTPGQQPRVVFTNPRVLTLATGVPAMAPIYAREEKILAEFRKRHITHVIIGDLGEGLHADSLIATLVRTNRRRFSPEYRNRSFVVYRMLVSDSAADRPSQ